MDQSSYKNPAAMETGKPAYQPPQIQTFSAEEFLELIGPAQGYGGGGGGGREPGGGNSRSPRLFPGLR